MKLDEWIKDNRAAFDQKEAPEGLWKNIQNATPQQKSKSAWMLWTSAAAVFILGFAAWMFTQNPLTVDESNSPKLPESFLAQEENYQQDLDLIESSIDLNKLASDPEYQWVFEELQELESINEQYRSDLQTFAPKEELLAVLIDYYEKRLRLLQRLQLEIERNKKHYENENINL